MTFSSDSEIHLWHIPLDVPPQDETLSPAERDRAARFYFERDRTRFINAHTALRHILSRYTDLAPHALTFQYNPYEKPSLVAPADLVRVTSARLADVARSA